jgi:hypothetical protein
LANRGSHDSLPRMAAITFDTLKFPRAISTMVDGIALDFDVIERLYPLLDLL